MTVPAWRHEEDRDAEFGDRVLGIGAHRRGKHAAANGIASAAEALKDRHAALLRPERPPATAGQVEAAGRLDAARERLQGGPRPDAPQLTLDLGSRG